MACKQDHPSAGTYGRATPHKRLPSFPYQKVVWLLSGRASFGEIGAHLCNQTLEKALSSVHPAVVQLLYRRHWLGIALSPVLHEQAVLLYLIAFYAFKAMVFKPTDPSVVRDYAHQDHLCIARFTTHRNATRPE
jgi:hypothetical protein